MIPTDVGKPEDGRFKATESLLTAIDRKKRELDARPMADRHMRRSA